MAPDAAAGDEVDLDAGFVQRAEHARVVGGRRARPGQHDGGTEPRRVRAIRRVRSNDGCGAHGTRLLVVDRDQL